MPSAAEECREMSGNCQGISHCLESGHPDYNQTWQLHSMVNIYCVAVNWMQEVKGQGHKTDKRPEVDVEAWWRHYY